MICKMCGCIVKPEEGSNCGLCGYSYLDCIKNPELVKYINKLERHGLKR